MKRSSKSQTRLVANFNVQNLSDALLHSREDGVKWYVVQYLATI
jgi:hypothetical protein